LLPSLISRSSTLWIWPRSYWVNCYIAHSCTCELKQADHKKRSSSGIISLPWFSKELKTTYRRTTVSVASSLYFSFANQYSFGGGLRF
jgi:hypothetical protein